MSSLNDKFIELKKAEDIFEYLNMYRKTTNYQFRGQSNAEWALVPKAGRFPYNDINDKEMFRHWKRRAVSFIEYRNMSDMDLLSIAQHTGLPTRLLDWTFNPLIAIFFACTENPEKDGAIFAYNAPETIASDGIGEPFAGAKNTTKLLQPSHTHSRLSNQFGYFTLHTPPSYELSSQRLFKVKIPKEIKKELVFLINQLGTNHMTVFPDLDGLSRHLSWFYENYSYWAKTTKSTDLHPPMG